jgi:hypothetical protein
LFGKGLIEEKEAEMSKRATKYDLTTPKTNALNEIIKY